MAFVIPMLLGFAGLAVDGSNIYYQSQRMQISADAAALGGARMLANNAEHAEVDAEIEQLAFANYADDVSWNYINDNRGVHVVTSRAINAYFARIYGHGVFTVTAEAEAQFEPVTGAGGLFPFTVDCNCDPIEGEGGDGSSSGDDGGDDSGDESGNGGGGNSSSPESNPNDANLPVSGMVELSDSQSSSYEITYAGQSGNTWIYEVEKVRGSDLNYWVLGINSCLQQIVSASPSGVIGTDGGTGAAGIKWSAGSGFTRGTFSFTLDDAYPSGEVDALAKAGTASGTVNIRGPVCDGTNLGNGNSAPVETSLCLPMLDFETDTAGAALVAGQIIDTEWAAWGLRVSTSNGSSHPAMIFSTASPTGGDNDLGAPNQSFGGPGVGVGGGSGMPGANSAPLGKVLVVAENRNAGNPDDNANGGSLIFTFDYAVRIDDVTILDIDDAAAAGSVKAYGDTSGATLVATGKMLGLGDNSVQKVALNAAGVRRLEVKFPKSGALASIVSCRNGAQTSYSLGNLLWSDANNNGIQDSGELGVAGVALELYPSGQSYLIAKATTNAGGEYRFSGLPAGSFDVKVPSANFGTGQPLAGARYSASNTGSNDGVDSDMSTATGKASVTLASADNLTVDGGFYFASAAPVDPGAQSAVVQVNDKKNSKYEVTLVSVVGNTWTYNVREVSGNHLDSWALGIENCSAKITASSPAGSTGLDSSTGFNGIRWSVANNFSNGNFSFTLDNDYQAVPRQVLAKAGSSSAQMAISGPDCSLLDAPPLPTDDPAPESTPAPGDEDGSAGSGGECVCEGGSAGFIEGEEYLLHEHEQNAPGNYGWLRWEGDGPNTPDLVYNIEHPEESGVYHIGDWIEGTTGVKNSSQVETALEYWEGKNITIPIYNEVEGNGSHARYRVCAFAVFELIDYSKADKQIVGRFVRTLINSAETDENAPDIGARDVRFLQ